MKRELGFVLAPFLHFWLAIAREAMRQYEPIWQKLKRDGRAKVSAPQPVHARIIKAVRKERDKDLAFRLLASEDCKRYTIRTVQKESMIEFFLESSFGLSDL